MTAERAKVDWDMMMRFGLGVLGLGPSEFWKMTPREFDAALKGKLGAFDDSRAMDRSSFSSLARAFPDGGRDDYI